ncbi:MAG: CCA tRNA nucleotidyltransferase [Desulfovibrionales bacterium]|nr:CCA tRNA nucleotidyltransferase [Desulfovibrionales bacterium]
MKSIILKLHSRGWKVFLVGGRVRDRVMGQHPGDPDLLTDAPMEDVEAIFGVKRVTLAEKSLPICIVNHVEISPMRGAGEFPTSDLTRRDFTLNAMALDPFSGTIIDPFGGRQDIKQRLIRFTGPPGDRIHEDPLRMVRGCRFAARFDFELEAETLGAIRAQASLIALRTAPERLNSELIKAMAMDRPSRFFELLHHTGLLPHILPSLERCWDLDGGPFHGETVFEHCMMVGDDIWPKQPLLRLAGFLHDTGKFDAKGIKEGRITYHGHERQTRALEADLHRLKFSNAARAYMLSLVRLHMRPLTEKTGPRGVRYLLAALAREGISHRDFMRMRIADKKSNLKTRAPYTLGDIRFRLNKIFTQYRSGAPLTPSDLALSGREIMAALNLKPGPLVGRLKVLIFQRVLDDPSLNQRDRLLALLPELLAALEADKTSLS